MLIMGESILGIEIISRYKRHEYLIDITYAVKVHEGETYNIEKVSRLHMGAYLCVASNSIQPTVSRRTQLKVQCEYMDILFVEI